MKPEQPRRTERFDARLFPDDLALIDAAARESGQTRTEFIIGSAIRRAKRMCGDYAR